MFAGNRTSAFTASACIDMVLQVRSTLLWLVLFSLALFHIPSMRSIVSCTIETSTILELQALGHSSTTPVQAIFQTKGQIPQGSNVQHNPISPTTDDAYAEHAVTPPGLPPFNPEPCIIARNHPTDIQGPRSCISTLCSAASNASDIGHGLR